METILIPLSKLRQDPANVRHPKEGDVALEVHTLQASLIEHGQRTALEVRPMRKPKGHYAVFAGGRRLLAFQGLAADGRLPADHPVRCDVHQVDDAMATELSAVENLERVNLKPTEEFELFARLAADGVADEDIARRMGCEVLHVRQRQRLGRLHPTVFAALDDGAITLDLAKAYASTEDQAVQARVFAELSRGYAHSASNVRNAIRGGASAYDTQKMLGVVGAQAYLAAGGSLEEDLFEGGVRVVNAGTLSDLYYAKLDEQTKALAATLPGNVQISTSGTGAGPTIFAAAALTDAQRDRLQAIDARSDAIRDELAGLGEREDEDAAIVADAPEDQATVDALVAEMDRLEDEGEGIHAAAAVALPEGPVIAVVEPRPDGMRITGYHRPLGWKPDDAGAVPAPAIAPEAQARAETGLTNDAGNVMQSHRRAILRGAMTADYQDVGHRFLLFTLARLVLNTRATRVKDGKRGYHHDYPSGLGIAGGLPSTSDPVGSNEVADQRGAKGWDASADLLACRPWMQERDADTAFALFLEAKDDEVEHVGAALGAHVIDRSLQAAGAKRPMHDALAGAMALDDAAIRRRFWTPDATWFDWLTKGRRLAAVAEVSPKASKAIAKLPTCDVSAACARFFAGDEAAVREFGLAEVEARYARMWVPAYLRFDEGDPPWVVARGVARALEAVS